MPTFQYTAKKGPQEVVEGVINAETRGGALSQLADMGYVPVRVTEQESDDSKEVLVDKTKPRRVPISQITTFTRQFASLTRSQVPMLRILNILHDQARHDYFRHVLRELTELVRQGETLSTGLQKFPRVFSNLYVNLIHSGEISGALDSVLERLADQAERDEVLRAKVKAAYTYPLFVGVVGFLTVTFLMMFVMPRLSDLLTGLGDNLPLPTQLLLAIVHGLSTAWFWGTVITIVLLVALMWRILGDKGRLLRDQLLLRLPIIGQLISQLEMARFVRSFGLLLNHGVSVMKAIDVAIPVVKHQVIRKELEKLPEGLRQGASLSSCMKQLSVGTPFLINTISVGEETGAVGDSMTEIASFYEREADRLLQTLSTLLEPTLIVMIGLTVGFIVMAVLLPIFQMSVSSF